MEDLVPFETATKLKEKGFRERCISHFQAGAKKLYQSQQPRCYNYRDNCYDAPTISQVLQWLREEKGIHIIAIPFDIRSDFIYWNYRIISIKRNGISDVYESKHDTSISSCGQAALAGIEYVLDNLI